MSIPLPKTPLVPLFMDRDCRQELDAMFRARDQEIVRCVLEAAANYIDNNSAHMTRGQAAFILRANAEGIRALEFHHE